MVKIEKLKQFLYQPNGQSSQTRSGAQRDASTRPPLGTISVILAALGMTGSEPSRVMSIAQPHNDALIVTLRIEGYDVKRVLVD